MQITFHFNITDVAYVLVLFSIQSDVSIWIVTFYDYSDLTSR